MKGDTTSGTNPATDRPNHASTKPTWSFHERYGSDAEFKRQVDEARRRVREDKSLSAIQSSLKMTRPGGGKLY